MTYRLAGVFFMVGLLAGCGYTRVPEERTDDGLVRVPSRASGGVYREAFATRLTTTCCSRAASP